MSIKKRVLYIFSFPRPLSRKTLKVLRICDRRYKRICFDINCGCCKTNDHLHLEMRFEDWKDEEIPAVCYIVHGNSNAIIVFIVSTGSRNKLRNISSSRSRKSQEALYRATRPRCSPTSAILSYLPCKTHKSTRGSSPSGTSSAPWGHHNRLPREKMSCYVRHCGFDVLLIYLQHHRKKRKEKR